MEQQEQAKLHTTVAVVGATGYVGSAVVAALNERGIHTVSVKAPRPHEIKLVGRAGIKDSLVAKFTNCSCVINAAGAADSTSADVSVMKAANVELPGIIAAACSSVETRLVHISSAAVQGRKQVLDDTEARIPFSVYSQSKAEGEVEVRRYYPEAIVYRPPGVHGPTRSVTKTLTRLAESRLSFVSAPGAANSPQALIGNVADAICYIVQYENAIPLLINHPSENITTSHLLELLSGKKPRLLPAILVRTLLRSLYRLSPLIPSLAPLIHGV